MQSSSYTTKDLPLAAFLQSRGHRLIDLVENERGRGVFVFCDEPDLREDILRWGNNESVSIRVRGFVNGLRDLKGLLGV